MKKIPATHFAIIIFAFIIGFFGANQILNANNLVLNAPKFVPIPIVWVYLSGALLMLGAVAFIIDRFAKPAGYCIAAILLLIVFIVHVPGSIHSITMPAKMLYVTNALKDTAMAMAAIVIGNLSKH